MTELTLSVRLTADGDALVGAVRVGKDELEKLSKTATSATRSQEGAARSMSVAGRAAEGASGLVAGLTRRVTALVSAWLGFQTVQKVLGDLVRETTNAERIGARLDAVLRSTGNAAGFARAELDRLADSLAGSTLFDDDSIKQSMAVMQTFKSVQGDAFRQAIELSADLAALLGTDLQSATLQLGKALEEPELGLTMLRRSGISFTESQQEMIKALKETGRVGEAQKIILQAIAGQLGGVAGAQNTGLVGATTGLTKAWDDLLEAFGRTRFVQRDVVGFLKGVKGGVDDLRALVEGGVPGKQLELAGLDQELQRLESLRRRGVVIPEIRRQEILRRQSELAFEIEELQQGRQVVASAAPERPIEIDQKQRDLLRSLAEQTQLIGRPAVVAEQFKALRSAGFEPTLAAGGVSVKDFEKLPKVFQEAVRRIVADVDSLSRAAFGEQTRGLERAIATADELRIGRALGPDARAGILGRRQALDFAAQNKIADAEQINLLQKLFTAQERANRELQLTEDLYDSLRGPQERYAERLRTIQREHASGGISAEEMRRATREAYLDMLEASREWEDGVKRGVIKVLDEAGDAARGFEDLTVGAFRRSEDAFVSWSRTGKANVADLFGFIEEQLLRIAFRALVVKPFLDPLEEAFSGFAKDLFAPSFADPSVIGPLGHAGGMVGGPNAFRPTVVPASVFEDAPRFRSGGPIGPGERPIIAHDGEVIGWPDQLRRAFGSTVSVEIIDQRGQGAPPIEAEASRGPDGRELIRVLVRSELAAAADDGVLDSTMRRNFGFGRVPQTRRS